MVIEHSLMNFCISLKMKRNNNEENGNLNEQIRNYSQLLDIMFYECVMYVRLYVCASATVLKI